jgi:hypothetical protein
MHEVRQKAKKPRITWQRAFDDYWALRYRTWPGLWYCQRASGPVGIGSSPALAFDAHRLAEQMGCDAFSIEAPPLRSGHQ